jgi:cell division transport system ATP-binding protein
MIYLDHVTKVYEQNEQENIEALNDVTLHIKPKEFVIVVGPSGAGKSTLVKLINREIKPDSGEVYVGGINYKDLKKKDIPYLRRKIGVVFQDYKLLPKKTVFENVAYALEVSAIKTKDIKDRVPKVLELVGLSKKAKGFPKELSGGERQRVAIARSLVHNPRILVADEPTGNLDPRNAWGLIEILLKINTMGTTVLMTTHNQAIVNKLRKRVIVLKNGKVIKDEQIGKYEV